MIVLKILQFLRLANCACLGLGVSHAAAQSCQSIDIAVCPTLFSDRCQSDDDFANANALQCVRVLNGTAKDAEECGNIDVAACTPQSCEESGDVLDRFFCERGKSQCTKTAGALAAEFDVLLSELDARLLNYKDVIELDTSQVGDRAALCEFSRQDLETFRTQALENADILNGYDEEISDKKSCTATLSEFMQSERPAEIPVELWQDITDSIATGLTEVSQREGTIRSQVEALAKAPAKLDALLLVHRIGCQ